MTDTPHRRATDDPLREQVARQTREIVLLEAQVDGLKSSLDEVKRAIDRLVTRHEFTPVKLLVYGLSGSILAGVVGALLSRVLVK